MPSTVIANHHYYARCLVCPWSGPLRYRRELALGDAARHDAEVHPDDDEPLVFDGENL
jgi:hypothetical protein